MESLATLSAGPAQARHASHMLELSNITKYFGPHAALSGISLALAPGEIHGLVGLNGSGKSTLLNILSGMPVIRRTGGFEGRIRVNGKAVGGISPAHAMGHGIRMVHQESSLFDRMSVAENVKLGREHLRPFSRMFGSNGVALPDDSRNIRDVETLFRKMGLPLDPRTMAGDLPLARRPFVELARAMDMPDLRVLLLDEPCASLNQEDAQRLTALTRCIAEQGVAVIYVSHSIAEVTGICERITVLKGGKVTAVFNREEFDPDRITRAMTGGGVTPVRRRKTKQWDAPLLSMENLSAASPGDRLNHITLDIGKGEILGLAGLSGHGKSALGPAVMGLCPHSGRISFNGRPVRRVSPEYMAGRGVCLLPEDRAESLLPEHTVMENVVFNAIQQGRQFRRKGLAGLMGFTDPEEMQRYAARIVETYHIRCNSIFQNAGELSGGNQQKLCLARVLGGNPNILFAGEPTRGIDLDAREVILDRLLRVNAEKGTTIVLSSESIGELQRICDRIAVFHKGRIAAILPPDTDEPVFAAAFSGEVRDT